MFPDCNVNFEADQNYSNIDLPWILRQSFLHQGRIFFLDYENDLYSYGLKYVGHLPKATVPPEKQTPISFVSYDKRNVLIAIKLYD